MLKKTIISLALLITIVLLLFSTLKLSKIYEKNLKCEATIKSLTEKIKTINKSLERCSSLNKNLTRELAKEKEFYLFKKDLEIKKSLLKKQLKVQYNKSFFNKLYFCIKNNTLNLACVSYYLSMLNFTYKKDQSDELEKTNEFIKRKGGDCEDWSYFFLSLVDYFKEKGINKIKVLERKNNSKVEIFKINNTIYYLQNYTYRTLDLDNFILFCYKINNSLGHCQNAIVNSIKNPKGIVIEPQNAEIDGKIENFKKIKGNNSYPIIILMDKYLLLVKKWNYWLVN